jgi:hypothetical protein
MHVKFLANQRKATTYNLICYGERGDLVKALSQNDFSEIFESLRADMQLRVTSGGNYFEADKNVNTNIL